MRFFTTISRHIHFRTVAHINDAKLDTLIASLKSIQGLYLARGFRIDVLHMDGQFEPLRLRTAAMGMQLNVTSNKEHVPEIERSIRTTKEQVRSVYATLPFKRLPLRFLIELVVGCILWLNAFAMRGGVSTTMSPRTIITGIELDFNQHCQMQCGEYVQTHEPHDNPMVHRTVGAIGLRQTGNAQDR